MIDCPVCGAHNFEYEEFCNECDSDLDPNAYEDDEDLDNYPDDWGY